jgi:hypothetical protein
LSNGYFISYWRGMVSISELPVPDARIFFCSARIPTGPSFNFWTIFYVEGSSSPITGRDDELNTYHSPKLADGTSYRVQNFPSADDLIKTVDGIGKNPRDQQSTIIGFFSMNLLRRLKRTLRFLAKTKK